MKPCPPPPFCQAAYHGKEAVMRMLLDAGADRNIKDNTGRTALAWAAEQGQEAVARLLLEAGADHDAAGG
ncbi:unnamed protein product, partial [Heterosigma akashiwo]